MLMTEEQLISKLQGLKQIKPRKEWVFLIKSQILGNDIFKPKVVSEPSYKDILINILRASFQRKFAYALAAFLFVVAGSFGFMKYGLPDSTVTVKIANQPQENLVSIKSNVEDFKAKSRNLSQIATLNSQDISSAIKEVEDAAKELINAIKKEPQLARAVALDINNNKTYLDVLEAGDLKSDLYKTVVTPILLDLKEKSEKGILTPNQESASKRAQGVYDGGNYIGALEDVLLLINSSDSLK